MATQNELRQRITDQIIEALKAGTPPWKRPWCNHHNAGHPVNVQTKRPYSGVNPLLLQIAAGRHGLLSKWWGTFNQWRAMGGTVKPRPAQVPPGGWGTQIVFFKPVTKTEINRDTGDEEEVRFGFLRSYTVFNVDQVDGLDHLRVGETPAGADFVDFAPAERAVQATGADIRFGGDRAFYRRPSEEGDGDYIQMPRKGQFTQEKDYYATELRGPRARIPGTGAPIATPGAGALAASPHLSNLTSLELSYQDIGDRGAQALAASHHLTNLASLDLRKNGIGNSGRAALERSPNLTHLTSLDLKDNSFVNLL